MNRIMNLLITLLITLSSVTFASDTSKELRWADQIVDALMDGEAEWLKAGEHEFLAIYTEAPEGEGNRAAIILHGIGVHPDWPQVVSPLRVGLAEHGWATLSLQMPVLPNEAEFEEYRPLFGEVAPRINAGLEFLKAQGIERVTIIAHSLGAAMASYYLAHSKSPIMAFVAVGMSSGSGDTRMDGAVSLESITIPVLDLYGSDDLETVVSSAHNRSSAADKAGNGAYKQVMVDGADHFFDGKEDKLVEVVGAWLKYY